MGRVSDTRARVREAADRLAAQGAKPTPTLVRELLGAGSPNTIVDELRLWAAAREPAPPAGGGIAQAAERLGLDELAAGIRASQQTQRALLELVAELRAGLGDITTLRESLGALASTCAGLASQLQTSQQWMREEVTKAHERFEGVQKMMLMAIDDARTETRFLKTRLEQAVADGETWRTAAIRSRHQLELENARLRGQLEALRAVSGTGEWDACEAGQGGPAAKFDPHEPPA